MYRKSVDYCQQSPIQVIQFSIFKRKTQPTLQLIIDSPTGHNIRVSKTQNSLLCCFVMSQLIVSFRPRSKKIMSSSTTTLHLPGALSTYRFFNDFSIDNVPKAFYNYQHEMTLQQLWSNITNKVKDVNIIYDLWVNYPIFQFVLNCYARKCIKNYIDQHNSQGNKLDLFGNQSQILNDYNAQIRGKLLDLLARALRIYVSVSYKDPGSHLQDLFTEYYGDRGSSNKIEITDIGQLFKIAISSDEQFGKLSSIQSSTSILQHQYFNGSKKQAQSLDTTMQGQSQRDGQCKSANKDLRCSKCNGKFKCECQKQKQKTIKRIVTDSKPIQYNAPTLARSIFDHIGLGVGPRRQNSTNQINVSRK